MTDIKILSEPLNTEACTRWVMTPDSGGINVFIGTVRNATKGKPVVRLDFEAYVPMALKEMQKIADEAFTRWPLNKILIHHRVGSLSVLDIPVIIENKEQSLISPDQRIISVMRIIDPISIFVEEWR